MLSIRQPPRVYSKNTIVRSKHSRVTLARPGRKPRQYPTDDAPPHAPSPDSPLTSGKQNEDATASSEKIDLSQRSKDNAIAAETEFISKTNSCFLCLQDGDHDYAVSVKFSWPGRSIFENKKGVRRKIRKASRVTEPPSITESFVREGTEVQAIQAIQDAIFKQSGRWKRWLWCYEIRAAEEIKVSRVRR